MEDKKFSRAKVKMIYDGLKAGKRYYCVDGPYHSDSCNLYADWDIDGKGKDKFYIFWRHYGSSADPFTMRDLEWVLNTIFHDVDGMAPGARENYRPFRLCLSPKTEWVMK